MQAEHFFQSMLKVSQYRLDQCKDRPYIDQIRRVIVQKGRMDFQYSSSVTNDGEIKSCMLFSKKQLEQVSTECFKLESYLKLLKKNCGVEVSRKEQLLGAVLPLIGEEKRDFWNVLAVNLD